MEDQVLRIIFKSGRIVERVGNDDIAAAIYAMDDTFLVDYILSMDINTGEVAFHTRGDDYRWDDEVIMVVSRGVR